MSRTITLTDQEFERVLHALELAADDRDSESKFASDTEAAELHQDSADFTALSGKLQAQAKTGPQEDDHHV